MAAEPSRTARSVFVASAVVALVTAYSASRAGAAEEFVNSLGMRLVAIPAGEYQRGTADGGDFDERPVHTVRLPAFHIAAHEVTNAQYERFDALHGQLRGKLGFSRADDEAAVFVSYDDAVGFCRWLSAREGRPYRLPTEAEWEYACRAGTTTAYHTGDALPAEFLKNARETWFPDPEHRWAEDEIVDLAIGRVPPNPWGLYDMHGNVEEWCLDWYGPYPDGSVVQPVGPRRGDFRVTRGGSHGTPAPYLRSANRAGTLPGDRHWLIGFRVVSAPEPRAATSTSAAATPLWALDVAQTRCDFAGGPPADRPHFAPPRRFVKIPAGSTGPLFDIHNHQPAITACPNGDLLAIWYSTRREPGRELAVAASRLRRGSTEWEDAALFWDAPDRNDHGNALWWDGRDTIYHFNGLGAAATWGNLALVMRTSTDNGATWSPGRLISPEHGLRHQVIASVTSTRSGGILLPCDASTRGNGGTALWVSDDAGVSWHDPGGKLAGIHGTAVELSDGTWLGLGRGDTIEGRMPVSRSQDRGQTWTRQRGPFSPIGGGQRLVLRRLREGPLLFFGFDRSFPIRDAAGVERTVHGLFAALSYDDGATWPTRRLVTDDGPARRLDGGAWTRAFTMSPSTAEPKGYLAATQTPDGVVHLISSALHYELNLAWLEAPMPALPAPPEKAGGVGTPD